jgi:hypothetical protein
VTPAAPAAAAALIAAAALVAAAAPACPRTVASCTKDTT